MSPQLQIHYLGVFRNASIGYNNNNSNNNTYDNDNVIINRKNNTDNNNNKNNSNVTMMTMSTVNVTGNGSKNAFP